MMTAARLTERRLMDTKGFGQQLLLTRARSVDFAYRIRLPSKFDAHLQGDWIRRLESSAFRHCPLEGRIDLRFRREAEGDEDSSEQARLAQH